MDRVTSSADDAVMKSFFALLQKNVLHSRRDTYEQLRLALVTWTERTYHHRRRQRALGELTPIETRDHQPGRSRGLETTPEVSTRSQHSRIRDGLTATDPTEGIIVSLGHWELFSYSSNQLMAIYEAASSDVYYTLIGVFGLKALRSSEARSLIVGDLRDGQTEFGLDVLKPVEEERVDRFAVPQPGAESGHRSGEQGP